MIVINGAGLAGLTCARLLAARGRRVLVVDRGRAAPPTLVLNEVTLTLLRDLWGPDVVAGGHVLAQRNVWWGSGAAPEAVRQTSVVVSGNRLAGHMRAALAADGGRVSIVDEADDGAWIVEASATGGADTRPLGNRVVLAADVPLAPDADPWAGWMETTPDGWVFLAPAGDGRAMFQAMVPARPADPAGTVTGLLAATRRIHWSVVDPPERVRVFAAAPWLREPVAGPGRLAIGEAAMRLDPVSGYGVAYALREAVLAAAVIDHGGTDALAHYRTRLRAAFHDHLRACVDFYGAAFTSPAWTREIEPMRRALAGSAATPPYRFRLRSTRLVTVENE